MSENGSVKINKTCAKDRKRLLSLLIAPIAVALTVLFVFNKYSLYPFGERTAAWCDMNQQVVPLLIQFKDILEGKSGMFLSFKNASGMNFWGVFFFFIASPFSFLVKFVEKGDMLIFANILIILKMMTCAFTSSLYLVQSREHKNLDTAGISMLSFMYAVSGYVMLFYQNVIWLDMMYLFPLLIMSLERLREKGRPLMYTAVMAAMMTVNYYIGYMVVIFVLLFSGMYIFFTARSENENAGTACRRFLTGSAIAAAVSAVVWVPCFFQYLTSGRKSSLIANLSKGNFVTDYDTVLPVMMCSSVLLLLIFGNVRFIKNRSLYHKIWLAAFVLLCVPLVIEPINKMWHTGSYMSFPARYAFMTIFAGIILASYVLQKDHEYLGSMKLYAVGGVLCAAAVFAYERSCSYFIDESIDTLSDYTKSLGGSESSFKGMCRLLILGLLCAGLIYLVYKKGWIFRSIFIVFTCALMVIEASGYIRIYMTTAAERNESTNSLQREVLGLSDKIYDDDSFYRVKTRSKMFDYNMIGAMGYNSIGHYTSLTNEDYMFTMKRMGYTSVWMEVGTCGGTELTDALLSIGYEISHDKTDSTVYSAMGYDINRLDVKLGLGVISTGDIPQRIPDGLTRSQIQQFIYSRMFSSDEKLVSEYEPAEGSYTKDKGMYRLEGGDELIYRIDVKGSQTLYFDCFDKLSNDLTEPIYDSFSVSVNGKTVARTYPFSKENGVLKLGEFNDEKVIVEVETLKDISCASFGVFGLDTDLLEKSCTEAQTLDLTEKKNGLTGSYDSESDKTVFLSVPYTEGFDIRVGGKKVEYREAFSGFIAFDIPSGSGDIDISFRPSGFTAGLILTICGIVSAAAYAAISHIRRKRNADSPAAADRAAEIAVAVMSALVFVAVYVAPTAVNIFMWSPEK